MVNHLFGLKDVGAFDGFCCLTEFESIEFNPSRPWSVHYLRVGFSFFNLGWSNVRDEVEASYLKVF